MTDNSPGKPEIVVREPDGSTRPATRDDTLDLFGVPADKRGQVGIPQPPVNVRVHQLPPGFWNSLPCRTCGAKIGRNCTYPSGKEAHTRHPSRETDVLAEAALDVIRAVIARQSAQVSADLANGGHLDWVGLREETAADGAGDTR